MTQGRLAQLVNKARLGKGPPAQLAQLANKVRRVRAGKVLSAQLDCRGLRDPKVRQVQRVRLRQHQVHLGQREQLAQQVQRLLFQVQPDRAEPLEPVEPQGQPARKVQRVRVGKALSGQPDYKGRLVSRDQQAQLGRRPLYQAQLEQRGFVVHLEKLGLPEPQESPARRVQQGQAAHKAPQGSLVLDQPEQQDQPQLFQGLQERQDPLGHQEKRARLEPLAQQDQPRRELAFCRNLLETAHPQTFSRSLDILDPTPLVTSFLLTERFNIPEVKMVLIR